MFHEPVLLQESLAWLLTDKSGIYLDGTVGGGGHSEAILQQLNPAGRLVGLDLDEEALGFARNRLKRFGQRIVLRQSNFKDMVPVLAELTIDKLDGILLDLGVSSHQIDTGRRWFSFSADGALDMRMSPAQPLTAATIVNAYAETELAGIFKTYGEERRARAVAKAIVKARKSREIATTGELREIVSRVLPPQHRVKSLARIFQALRIAVNRELSNLADALQAGLECLKINGRIVIVSYHSLEDRIVKDFFRYEAADCECPPEVPVCVCGKSARLKILTKRPVRAGDQEVASNPRSRSAKLRAAERIA